MLTHNCITVENGFFFGANMLYEKNKEASLSPELFKNPTAEYRSTPFWAWNSNLDRAELARQIDAFAEMGFGGFHMHVRQGLESTYLGEDFLDAIRFCTEYAKSKNMLAWLYDEDRWPSGVAGGMVTKNKKHRQKFLTMSVTDRENCAQTATEAAETGNPYFVAAFDITVDSEGRMTSYRKIGRDEPAENKRYFFLEQKQGGEPRYNYQSYVDTLSKEAIDEFIKITHDSFKRVVGGEFGKAIPAIFTDEPQVSGFAALKSGFDKRDARCSYTTDFADTYRAEFGEELTDKLPELFFATDIPTALTTRYNYYAHLAERFNTAYMDNIGEWCEGAGIALTGHMLGEDTLYEAALNSADIMRAYRKMQMPGIDILCDDVVYQTPVQCRSAVRQYGREAMMSELYGVTGWDFDFRGHKYQGDWQAALGVNVRVPHLAWQSMKGEGKRDYPAAISYQSSWYKEYKYLEDHYARINTALTRGTPEVNIGVIHPTDSYNILFASVAETIDAREELDRANTQLCEWLLSGAYDFDYISESLLPDLCTEGTSPLAVGKMKYDVIIVANCTTLRPHTIKVLDEFKKKGGKLIFVGRTPTLSLGKPSDSAAALTCGATVLNHSKAELYSTIAPYRKVDVRDTNGAHAAGLISTLRTDGESKWLFLANMYKTELPHLINKRKISISVEGLYKPTVWNTLTGEVEEITFRADKNKTTVYATLYDLDTLLLKLDPIAEPAKLTLTEDNEGFAEVYHPAVADYRLSEPNVLLLDMAKFSADGAPLSEHEEEIMRIDAAVRATFGLQSRRTKFVQPWAIDGSPEDHTVRLVYTVKSEIRYTGALLAMENPEKATVTFNSVSVDTTPVGYYADRDIKMIKLPVIEIGDNVLEISMPFGLRTDLEACYITGDFGCAYVGREARITEKCDRLHFGSVVHQGLPFFGGNVEYDVPLSLESDSDVEITVSQYRGALVGVKLDGVDVGRIAFQPFKLRLDNVKAGSHTLTYTLFGTRYNTFSAIHNLNAGKRRMYMGPDFWRSADEAWAYEYQTRPMGILKTPVLKLRKR